jgi:hypothetical protein
MVVAVCKYSEQSLNCLQAANWLKVYKVKIFYSEIWISLLIVFFMCFELRIILFYCKIWDSRGSKLWRWLSVWCTFTNILEEHAVMVKEYNIFLRNGGKYVPD